MSLSFELDPVDRITAGAVGEPGERVFFVQAEAGGRQVTLLAEKEQVHILAQALVRLVGTVSEGEEEPRVDEALLELRGPLDPQWRAGQISIQYDEDRDRVEIVITEAVEESAEGEESGPEPASARFVATRVQARALVDHALAVVAAGRPRCQFCGNPLEADREHMCPAMNGHRSAREE
jgi:uncharacterized repeat protein (TIGR03847 family)